MTIVGYYHVCAINNYRTIVQEQIAALKASGLFAATDHINVCLLTTSDEPLSLFRDPKFRIRIKTHNFNLYERQILNFMLEDALRANRNRREYSIWYIHSKGVSDRHQNPTSQKRIRDWRKLLEAFVIWNWSACHRKVTIEKYDTCSANYSNTPPHYSGNFWWTRSNYIAKRTRLPMKGNYVDPEMWLFKSKPRSFSFYNTNPKIWCYDKNYPMPNLTRLGHGLRQPG